MSDTERRFDYFKESYPAWGDPAHDALRKAFLELAISEAEFIDASFYIQHLQRKLAGLDGRLTAQEMYEIKCSEYAAEEV